MTLKAVRFYKKNGHVDQWEKIGSLQTDSDVDA